MSNVLTRAELRARVAEIAGWKRHPDLVAGDAGDVWLDPDGETHLECPDWLNDSGAALDLLPEISCASPDRGGGFYVVLTDCWHNGWRLDMRVDYDGDALLWSVAAPSLALAICVALVREKTGECVEMEGVTWNEVIE
jgi:hypothetical protein